MRYPLTAALAAAVGYLAAPDKVECHEDQVILWSGHDHSTCFNLDDLQEVTR